MQKEGCAQVSTVLGDRRGLADLVARARHAPHLRGDAGSVLSLPVRVRSAREAGRLRALFIRESSPLITQCFVNLDAPPRAAAPGCWALAIDTAAVRGTSTTNPRGAAVRDRYRLGVGAQVRGSRVLACLGHQGVAGPAGSRRCSPEQLVTPPGKVSGKLTPPVPSPVVVFVAGQTTTTPGVVVLHGEHPSCAGWLWLRRWSSPVLPSRERSA